MKTADQLIIDRLLSKVIDLGATDLHLSAGNPPTFRVDGKLTVMEDEQMVIPEFLETIRDDWLTDREKEILKKEKEIIVSKTFKDKMRFRINIFYQQGFPSFALRYIPNIIRSLDELGLPAAVRRFALMPDGLVLIGGSFGSGRSTTMMSLIQTLNQQQAVRVVTLEKPVEMLIADQKSVIDQREAGLDVASIEEGLDQVLGEDIDVVMVSEIVTRAEVEKALTIADSGRLLLTTFNGESFYHMIDKMVSLFIGEERTRMRGVLSRTLRGAVIQKLLPKQGGGRIAASEVVFPGSAMNTLIRDGNLFQLSDMVQHSRERGIVSMDQSLADLVSKGLVKPEDAEREANDPASFRNRLQQPQNV